MKLRYIRPHQSGLGDSSLAENRKRCVRDRQRRLSSTKVTRVIMIGQPFKKKMIIIFRQETCRKQVLGSDCCYLSVVVVGFAVIRENDCWRDWQLDRANCCTGPKESFPGQSILLWLINSQEKDGVGDNDNDSGGSCAWNHEVSPLPSWSSWSTSIFIVARLFMTHARTVEGVYIDIHVVYLYINF